MDGEKPFLDIAKITATASECPNRWSDKVPSRAMTVEEIHEFVEAFAKTAKLIKDAGVDGVEIHAVHEGYLLDQFTLKYVNHRTDEYGGSFHNRYRFAVEIVQAIKKVCGDDFPVSLRYSVVSKTKGFREAVCLANSSYLREWFALHEVPVYLETMLKEVREDAVVCTDKDGKDFEVKCDSVIGSVGYIPNPVAPAGNNVHLVGDCDKIGNLRTVIWQAYETAMKI